MRSSPGRKGDSQRTSSTPGEPSDAARVMKPSAIIRIISEQRCQPEPDRPRSMLLAGGLLVEVHRLRIELGGESQDLVAGDMARAERAEPAGREIFEGQGHLGNALRE